MVQINVNVIQDIIMLLVTLSVFPAITLVIYVIIIMELYALTAINLSLRDS